MRYSLGRGDGRARDRDPGTAVRIAGEAVTLGEVGEAASVLKSTLRGAEAFLSDSTS